MGSTTPETHLVFVPGMASVGEVVYAPLVNALTALGHSKETLHIVQNISCQPDLTKAPSMDGNALQKDIEQIQALLKKLVTEQRHDVLLVAHSYGGTPAIYASSGLWKHQRTAAGAEGGVLKIALISSSLTLPGGTIAGDRAAWQAANGLPPDGGDVAMEMAAGVSTSLLATTGNLYVLTNWKEMYIVPTGFEHFWMNDITDEAMRSSLKPSAMSSVMGSPPADADGPESWRLAYLILTELDIPMPEGLQRHLVGRAREAGAQIEESTMKSGHFAQVSHAKEVAEWVRGLL
jgi:pimeloyl-ACP methyl ester carboxylesterase